MNRGYEKQLKTSLGKIANNLSTLADRPIQFDVPNTHLATDDDLWALQEPVYVARTVRGGDKPEPMGVVLSEKSVLEIGAGVLVMRNLDAGMTEEVQGAFEEAFNVLTGAWNEVASAQNRMSPKVEDRQFSKMSQEEFRAYLQSEGVDLACVPATIAEEETLMGFFAVPEWMGGGARDGWSIDYTEHDVPDRTSAAGAATAYAPVTSPPPSEPSPPPAAEPPKEDRSAHMVLVDVTGSLQRWMASQMVQGTQTFTRSQGIPADLDGNSAILLLKPGTKILEGMDVGQVIIMRPGDDG